MKHSRELKNVIEDVLQIAQGLQTPDSELAKIVDIHVKDFIAQKLAAAYFLEFASPEDVVTFLIDAFGIKRLKMASEFVAMAREEKEKV